jgi:hypothetical protein
MVKASPVLRCWLLVKEVNDPMLTDKDVVCLVNSILQYLETYGVQHNGAGGIVNSVGELRLIVDLVRLARGGLVINDVGCLSSIVSKFGVSDPNAGDLGFARFRRAVAKVLKALTRVKVNGEPIVDYTPCDDACKTPGVVNLRRSGVGFRCPEVRVETGGARDESGKVDIDNIVRRLTETYGPSYIGFEWAVKKTLKYLEEKGRSRVSDIATDLKGDYMWIVRYLYWLHNERSIPKLVKGVLEELAKEGMVKIEGDTVSLVK